MPRKAVQWDVPRGEGNPTKSPLVNQVIKNVKKAEIRKEGASPKARRELEYNEYLLLLTLIRKSDHKDRFLISSLLCLQWQLIGRVDDLSNVRFDNFHFNMHQPDALMAQLTWSKNILEERDSPVQIVLPSNDPRMCALLNLVMYMETYSHRNLAHDEPLFGSNKGKAFFNRYLKSIFQADAFENIDVSKLGTHSLRKGSTTYASRACAHKDYVDRRGRWRGHKRQVDTYISMTLPFPDAEISTILCGPSGACRYTAREGVSVPAVELGKELCPNTLAGLVKIFLLFWCVHLSGRHVSLIQKNFH